MPVTVRRADLHQHFWPEGLLSSLARRTAPPRLRRGDGGWWLELAGAPPSCSIRRGPRPARLRTGFDRVLIAPSLPLGIEALPVGEAEALLDDFHAGVLGRRGSSCGPRVPLGDPVAGASRTRRATGLCLPAGALAPQAGSNASARLLEALERRRCSCIPARATAAAGGRR